MAEEILNEGLEPVEDKTKVLFGIHKKSDDTLLAVTKEQYAGYDKRSYAVDGFIIRNEDEDVNLLYSPTESVAIFGIGPADIPETDSRRKKANPNPQFTDLDGKERTEWQLRYHPDTHEAGCAICEAVKFGWLPSGGEMKKAFDYKDEFDELATLCGASLLSGERYWLSSQYSEDYMWNMIAGETVSFEFWHCKNTQMTIRPVKSASGYEEVTE